KTSDELKAKIVKLKSNLNIINSATPENVAIKDSTGARMYSDNDKRDLTRLEILLELDRLYRLSNSPNELIKKADQDVQSGIERMKNLDIATEELAKARNSRALRQIGVIFPNELMNLAESGRGSFSTVRDLKYLMLYPNGL